MSNFHYKYKLFFKMEDWQVTIIRENLDKLIEFTTCHTVFLTELEARKILSKYDLEHIMFSTTIPREQVQKFYTIVISRTNALDNLIDVLRETKQTGALDILIRGKNRYVLNELKQLKMKCKDSKLFDIVMNEDLSTIKGVLESIATDLKVTKIWKYENTSVLHIAVARGDYDVVEYLVNNQGFKKVLSDPRFKDTLVHDCMENIHKIEADAFTEMCRILKLLFTKSPQLIESRGFLQRTALHVAVREFVNGKQVEFIEMLLRHKANVNAKAFLGNTPLHLLFFKKDVPGNAVEIMRLLITHNANPDALNKSNQTFLHLAAQNASPSLFHEVMVYLVSIHKTNSFTIADKYDGYTVLHQAVLKMKGDPLSETLEIFKTHRINFNTLNNKKGDSVMFTAIEGERSEDFLRTLIRFGADWTIRNNNQETALHKAAFWNNMSALKLFISLEADVNAKDVEGNTPLHQALFDHDIVAELVSNGADPTLKNNKGQSPIDFAKQRLKIGKLITLMYGNVEQRTVELLENASRTSS